MKKTLGVIIILLGLGGLFFLAYVNSNFSRETRTFSIYSFLESSWNEYKKQYINSDGRVIDYSVGGITTSEGQSYAMLRAVWIDDKDTFDKVWSWTKNTLKRPKDNLFGWKWGQNPDKTYGFIAPDGGNSASDADTNIALALILASRRWQQNTYLDDAKNILDDIWTNEIDTQGNTNYLVAGNWAKSKSTLAINPSYFSPAAWRVFGQVDTKHDWNSLIEPAYNLLDEVSKSNLDKKLSSGLPPDWILIDKESGKISPATSLNPKLTTNYSFDAIRVPLMIAIDWQWNKEDKAKNYLTNSFGFLTNQYKNIGKLESTYAHDGSVVLSGESPSMYATSLAYLSLTNPDLAKKVYDEKIIRLYSNSLNTFRRDLGYYDQNMLWFGAALYNGRLFKI